jgi:hypothetical protein
MGVAGVTRQGNKSSCNGVAPKLRATLGPKPAWRHLPPAWRNLTSRTTRYSAVETTQVNTNMSSQDAYVRHQAVVPDKIPTGEYPVSQLRSHALCN